MYTMGVDIGSASSKAVILKDGKDVLAAEVVQVGTGSTGPKKAMEMAFEKRCEGGGNRLHHCDRLWQIFLGGCG